MKLTMKAASLDERIRRVREAWYSTFVPNRGMPNEPDYWIAEVYEDHVIVEKSSDGYFSYSYTVDENDAIEFGEPEPVKKETEYVPVKYAVKTLHESPTEFVIGGYGHIWGGPKKDSDLQRQYFTAKSNFMPGFIPEKLIFFEHSILDVTPDGDQFDYPIGKSLDTESYQDKVGKWVTARLDKRKRYVDAVMQLVDGGAINWSSGSIPHLVKMAPDGWLQQWPVAEYTATVTPVEPRMTNVTRTKAAYKAAGIDVLWQRVEKAEGPEGEGNIGDANRLALVKARFNLLKLRG